MRGDRHPWIDVWGTLHRSRRLLHDDFLVPDSIGDPRPRLPSAMKPKKATRPGSFADQVWRAVKARGNEARLRLKERYEIRLRGGARHLTIECPSSRYYADPFLFEHQGKLQMFFEEFDYASGRARLARLAIASDGTSAPMDEIHTVLEQPYHLSFPFVFHRGGRIFMIPESHENRTIDLYECVRFPDEFVFRRTLLSDLDAVDTVVHSSGDRVWLLTSVRSSTRGHARHLAIFHANDLLTGEFAPHPVNAERRFAGSAHQSGRNAGPLVERDGRLFRPAQKNVDYYGQGLEWREILQLTETRFEEQVASNPLLTFDDAESAHHVSSWGDLVAYDVRTLHRW
jgi:hypothetical protein